MMTKPTGHLRAIILLSIVSGIVMLTNSAAVASAGQGKTYFVRTNGNNANDGLTVNTAFATIQMAVNSSRGAGNTIYIGKGTYREMVEIGYRNGKSAGNGTANNPNRIIGDYTGQHTGDGSGPVIIDGRGKQKYGINIKKRNGWTIQGVYLKNQKQFGIYSHTSSDLIVSNCTIQVPDFYALWANFGNNLRIEDVTFERTPNSGSCIYDYGTSGQVVIQRNRLSLLGKDYLSLNYQHGLSYQKYEKYEKGETGENKGEESEHTEHAEHRKFRIVYGIVFLSDLSPKKLKKSKRPAQVTIQNNVVSDAYFGIYVDIFGPNDTAFVNNNSISGCYFGLKGDSDAGSAVLTNNIVTNSYVAVDGDTKRTGRVTIDGLLTYSITKIPIIITTGKRVATSNIIENADPLWKDPANGDFSFPLSSPAVDAAVGSYFAKNDIRMIARPYNAKHLSSAVSDFGAYEYDPSVDGAQRPQLVQWQEDDPDR